MKQKTIFEIVALKEKNDVIVCLVRIQDILKVMGWQSILQQDNFLNDFKNSSQNGNPATLQSPTSCSQMAPTLRNNTNKQTRFRLICITRRCYNIVNI